MTSPRFNWISKERIMMITLFMMVMLSIFTIAQTTKITPKIDIQNKYDILEPIKSFYEKDGTYINIDEISQTVYSAIDKDNPMKDIKEVLK